MLGRYLVYVIDNGGSSGGGGYVFADLAELDAVIAEWVNLRDGIQADGRKLLQARELIEPPAKDLMSQWQPAATRESLSKAIEHNEAMRDYANTYVEKLQAARVQYTAGDEESAAGLRRAGGG